jgi:hypothetical protein
MARKRMIDPALWTDPKVIQLDTKSVMVFVGIITHADDEGIIELDPTSLYFKLARTDITLQSIPKIIQNLESVALIRTYGTYGFLPTWYKHQNLKGRKPQPTKAVRPPAQMVSQYPQYQNEWEETFSTKDHRVEYPYHTCFTTNESPVVAAPIQQTNEDTTSEQPVVTRENTTESADTTGESLVSHQCATSSTPVALNRSEVKGSEKNRNEKKGSENNPRRSADPLPPPEPIPESQQQQEPSPTESQLQAEELAQLLEKLHQETDSHFHGSTVSWSKDIEKLIRIDGRNGPEVEKVIRWCKQPQSFWFPNIVSGRKLREKYPTLLAQMQQERNKSSPKRYSSEGFKLDINEYEIIGR